VSALQIALVGVFLFLPTTDVHAQEAMRLAVTYFDNRTGDATLDDLGRGLADMLITDLAGVSGVEVVERARLNELIDEMALVEKGFVAPETAATLGRGLGARYVLIGSFASVDPTFRIDARIVEVQTSKVIHARSVSGTKSQFFRLEKELAKAILGALSIHLSDRASMRMERVSTQSFEAIQAWSRGLASLDRGAMNSAQRELKAALGYDDAFAEARLALASIEKRIDSMASTREATRTERGAAAVSAARHYRADRTPVAYEALVAAVNPWTRIADDDFCEHAKDIRAIAGAVLDLALTEARLIRTPQGEMPFNEWALQSSYFAATCLWDTPSVLADGQAFLERYPLSSHVKTIEESMRDLIDIRRREEQGIERRKQLEHEERALILSVLCTSPRKAALQYVDRMAYRHREDQHQHLLTERLYKVPICVLPEEHQLRVCRDAWNAVSKLAPTWPETTGVHDTVRGLFRDWEARDSTISGMGSLDNGALFKSYLEIAVLLRSKPDLAVLKRWVRSTPHRTSPKEPEAACAGIKKGTERDRCLSQAQKKVSSYKTASKGDRKRRESRLEKIAEGHKPYRSASSILEELKAVETGRSAAALLLELRRAAGAKSAFDALDRQLRRWPTVNALHRAAILLAWQEQDWDEAQRRLDNWKASSKIDPPAGSPVPPRTGLPRTETFDTSSMKKVVETGNYTYVLNARDVDARVGSFQSCEAPGCSWHEVDGIDDDFAVRWTAWLGRHRENRKTTIRPLLSSNGTTRVWIDGQQVMSVDASTLRAMRHQRYHNRSECAPAKVKGPPIDLSDGKRHKIRIEFQYTKGSRPERPCTTDSGAMYLEWEHPVDPEYVAKRKAEAESRGQRFHGLLPADAHPNLYTHEREHYAWREWRRWKLALNISKSWSPRLESRLRGMIELGVVRRLVKLGGYSEAAQSLLMLVDSFPKELQYLGGADEAGLRDPRPRRHQRKKFLGGNRRLKGKADDWAAYYLLNAGVFAEEAARQPLAKKAYSRLLKDYGETSFAPLAREALARLPR